MRLAHGRAFAASYKAPMPAAATLRAARPADAAAISAIYNHYVVHDTCTYDEEPETLATRQEWLAKHGPEHPVLVAEAGGEIVGWGSLSAFRARPAYRHTVENSVYLRHDWHRRGVGALLLTELIARARALGHHAIIAGISAEQAPSLAIHAKHGFVEVARLREVGHKFGRWLDVVYLELLLDGP
jgi:phosphinothricin acetyltransferase